jgi:hypothetical protein
MHRAHFFFRDNTPMRSWDTDGKNGTGRKNFIIHGKAFDDVFFEYLCRPDSEMEIITAATQCIFLFPHEASIPIFP